MYSELLLAKYENVELSCNVEVKKNWNTVKGVFGVQGGTGVMCTWTPLEKERNRFFYI